MNECVTDEIFFYMLKILRETLCNPEQLPVLMLPNLCVCIKTVLLIVILLKKMKKGIVTWLFMYA